MKTVTAGLLSFLLLNSCGHMAADTKSAVAVSLPKVAGDSRFKLTGDDQFRFVENSNLDLKILRYAFKSSTDAQTYLLNRRMLLHRSFQDEVAPYFGLIRSEQDCLAQVDISAEMKTPDAESEYFYMQLPINENKVVLDCHQKEIWGLAKYYFYHCKKNNDVFEVRYARRRSDPAQELNISCR